VEESVSKQLDLLIASQEEELIHIKNYLMHLIHESNGSGFNGLVGLLQDVHNGLSRSEANYLVNRFLVKRSDDSGVGSLLQLRTTVDGEELLSAMRYARKLTLMRSALDGVSFSGMTSIMGRLLIAEKTKLQHVDADSHFVPFPLGMKVLELSRRLLVNLATRMQILAWSDCFDKELQNLALEKFRDHAANSICKHNMLDMMKTRAEIVSISGFGEKAILSGMTEPELQAQLEESFQSVVPLPASASSEQSIKYTTFCDALVNLPDINLSEAEIATLASLFTAEPQLISKDDLLPFSPSRDLRRLVFSITTLCRERHINRRMALHIVSSHAPSNSDSTPTCSSPDNKSAFALRVLKKEYKHLLQATAEKLLTFTKLTVQSGDVLCITLPSDSGDHARKRTSVKASSLDSTLLDDNVLAFSEMVVQWCRLRVHLPSKPNTPNIAKVVSRVSTSKNGGPNLSRSSVSKLSAADAPIVVEFEKVETLSKPATLTISIHEDLQTLAETQLVCRCVVRSSDTEEGVTEEIVTALNVKLPSLALVDRDAAVEFASNLMSKIYVEEVIGKSTELKINE